MFGLWRARRLLEGLQERARLSLARRTVARFPREAPQRPHGLRFPLIVSLTSYPARFDTVSLTLRSLLDQEVRPDRVILWIARKDFPALPDDVRALRDHGLEIRPCDDLRSFKKLVPALVEFPEAAIVTADDDIYYPPDWLGRFLDSFDPRAPSIVAQRAHLALFDPAGFILPYESWEAGTAATRATRPGTALFPTGVAGVLYPPGALHAEVLNTSQFMRLCPHADDVWFFWMARLAGTEQRRTPGRFQEVSWPSSQDSALWRRNVGGQENDAQVRAVERAYGPVPLPVPLKVPT